MDYNNYLLNIINNTINFENDTFVTYTKNQEIIYNDNIPKNSNFINFNNLQKLLFDSSVKVIKKFSKSKFNKNVYAMFLFIDLECCANGLVFCTESEYKKKFQEVFNEEDDFLNTINSIKYSSGDSPFRYFTQEFNTKKLNYIVNAYYAISTEDTITNTNKNYTFLKSLFESRLIQIGMKVLEELKSKNIIKSLNKTKDFLMTTDLHDVGNEIKKKLFEQCNSKELLKTLFSDYQ